MQWYEKLFANYAAGIRSGAVYPGELRGMRLYREGAELR